MNYINRPDWELRNMVKALSMHKWLNTPEEDRRLEFAKLELKRRNSQGFNIGRKVRK